MNGVGVLYKHADDTDVADNRGFIGGINHFVDIKETLHAMSLHYVFLHFLCKLILG